MKIKKLCLLATILLVLLALSAQSLNVLARDWTTLGPPQNQKDVADEAAEYVTGNPPRPAQPPITDYEKAQHIASYVHDTLRPWIWPSSTDQPDAIATQLVGQRNTNPPTPPGTQMTPPNPKKSWMCIEIAKFTVKLMREAGLNARFVNLELDTDLAGDYYSWQHAGVQVLVKAPGDAAPTWHYFDPSSGLEGNGPCTWGSPYNPKAGGYTQVYNSKWIVKLDLGNGNEGYTVVPNKPNKGDKVDGYNVIGMPGENGQVVYGAHINRVKSWHSKNDPTANPPILQDPTDNQWRTGTYGPWEEEFDGQYVTEVGVRIKEVESGLETAVVDAYGRVTGATLGGTSMDISNSSYMPSGIPVTLDESNATAVGYTQGEGIFLGFTNANVIMQEELGTRSYTIVTRNPGPNMIHFTTNIEPTGTYDVSVNVSPAQVSSDVAPGGTYNFTLTVDITEISSVGGVVVPVDKLGLLTPYIGLTATILAAAVASTVYVKRGKRREEKQ